MSRRRIASEHAALSAFGTIVFVAACSSSGATGADIDAGGAGNNGGSSASGGSATGGSATGGSATGGSTTGGRSGGTGGGSAGSSATGGATNSGGTGGSVSGGAGTADPNDVVVAPSDVHQKMDGFGASDRNSGTLSDAQADLLFDPTKGIGLSLLRVSINPSGADSTAYSNATKAAARGAKIWGAPWTPPANWKDNCSRSNGGHLCASAGQNGGCSCDASHYDDWANALAGFAAVMKSNAGISLYAVSVQNEPDYTAGYDSCLYSSQEMVNFIKVLGPKLAALSPRPKLMMPETSGFSNVWSYWDAVSADSTAKGYVDILATHQYFVDSPPSHAVPTGKTFWQTEDSSFEGYDGSIDNGLKVAGWIDAAVANAEVSAWHYWELVNNADDQGVYNGTTPAKRTYVLGNYARFVRPGYDRVGLSGKAPPSGVRVTAYVNASDHTVVIVAINTNTTSTDVPLFVSGTDWPRQMTPWVTSASDDLASKTPISVTGARFTAKLAARSVTTLVGAP